MSSGETQGAVFLAGGGDMGARMRSHAWAATPLGPPANWPQSLRIVLRLMLTSNHPMFVFWGPRHTCFYNDAYSASLGPEKHPAMLGADGRGAWDEIWEIIGPQIEMVMRGEGATWHENHLVPIIRHGELQDVYWTYSYSPIDDVVAPMGVGGVLVVCTETTAQVLAGRAHEEAAKRFAELFEQAPVFIAMLEGPDHVFTLANPAYQQLTGQRELVGKPVREAVPEIEGQGLIELLDRVFATGEPFIGRGVQVELQRTPDGPAEKLVVDFVYQPVLGADGRPRGIFVGGSDATDRARAEAAATAMAERLRLIQDAGAIGSFDWDLQSGAIYRSPEYLALHGLPAEAATENYTDAWLDRVHADDRDGVAREFAENTARVGPFEREYRIVRPDTGETRWLLNRGRVNGDAQGRPVRLLSAQTDITERKRAEAALRESRQRFQDLADNIPSLCWMAEPDGHIFWYNSRWYEYTGTSADDQLGWGWESVHDPEILPLVAERWSASLTSGEPFEMTFPLKGADGVFRPFLTRVVPLRDEDGEILRWFGANVDVSEQHRSQQHLRLMVNELNHRVKNTLATVQSIIAQTVRGAQIPLAVRDALTARLMALSDAHNVLTDEQWAGADLGEIAAQAAIPYQSRVGDGRFTLQGPPVRLPPRTAIAIALALHELATNAAKYGALSTPEGRVSLGWEVADPSGAAMLRIVWRETGGPPVRPPTRTGFGTRLIERGLASELNGRVVLAYPPQGAVCTIEARLESLAATSFAVAALAE